MNQNFIEPNIIKKIKTPGSRLKNTFISIMSVQVIAICFFIVQSFYNVSSFETIISLFFHMFPILFSLFIFMYLLLFTPNLKMKLKIIIGFILVGICTFWIKYIISFEQAGGFLILFIFVFSIFIVVDFILIKGIISIRQKSKFAGYIGLIFALLIFIVVRNIISIIICIALIIESVLYLNSIEK